MDELLRDLASHNIKNRTIGLVENGSWASTSAKIMKEILQNCKNITFVEKIISMKSALKTNQIDVLRIGKQIRIPKRNLMKYMYIQ